MDLRKTTVVSLIMVALCVAACGGGGDRAAVVDSFGGDQEPVGGDWLIMSKPAEPDSLNRIIGTNAYAAEIWSGLMGSFVGEYLLGYDPVTWRLDRPILAESYPEISDDRLTYTFTIRDGVHWHDGELFTAEDVLFSLKATMLPSVDSASLRGYFSDLVDVQTDGRQIRFEMSQPYWMNAAVLGNFLVIIPKHVYDPDGILDAYSYDDITDPIGRTDEILRQFGEQFNRHPANRAPVGTGPFVFESWESSTEITVVRNDDYWGEPAHLSRVVVRLISDPTAALTALKSGDTAFFPDMTPIQWAQQTSNASFETEFVKANFTVPSFSYIGWNAQRPFFSDRRVRQAMTMLVPRQQIIDTVRFGLAEVATGPFNPSSSDFNPNIDPFSYDPVRAVALLDEAGWIDHDGDGIRDKDGVKFSFELQGSSGSQFVDQLLPILADEFERVGIEMTERRLEFTVLVENARDHRFDANTMGWISDLVVDPYQLWHSSSIVNRGSNYVSFNNPEADRLIEDARIEFDPLRRRELYWEFQAILHEEQPYTFLMYPQETVAYHRRFQDVEFLPPSPGYDLTKWFVPRAAQRFTEVSPQ